MQPPLKYNEFFLKSSDDRKLSRKEEEFLSHSEQVLWELAYTKLHREF